VHTLKALALAFDAAQDRILAVVNPAGLDSWSFWFTRRLVLQVLGRLPSALEATSPVTKQAPAEYRADVLEFERQAALATTAKAMTQTDPSTIRMNAASAELASGLSISEQGGGFRVDIRGERGGQAAGVLGRAELQRILQMLHEEATKGAWLNGVTSKPTGPIVGAPPKRH
jgi:hypothetical protein